MNTTQLGILGEARTITELIKQDYDVFTQFSGKSPFDIVAFRNNQLVRVEVKSTACRSKYDTGWEFALRKSRHNKSGNTIHTFNNSESDILALYVEPIDRVIFIKSIKVNVKHKITILDSDLLNPSDESTRMLA